MTAYNRIINSWKRDLTHAPWLTLDFGIPRHRLFGDPRRRIDQPAGRHPVVQPAQPGKAEKRK